MIDIFIEGIPYCQNKVRGRTSGGREWSHTVIEQTKAVVPIQSECKAIINFFLPSNKYPLDHPYGPDLDNLTKRLFDALNKTVFSKVPGNDGAVVELEVSKKMVPNGKRTGCHIMIREINAPNE